MATNPRLQRATLRLERRLFLKALAFGLSLPVSARLSRDATAQATPPPKRFLVLYLPHGVAPEHYNPRVSESDLTRFDLDQTNLSILAPLQPYKHYVNVYEGFQYLGDANAHTGIVN